MLNAMNQNLSFFNWYEAMMLAQNTFAAALANGTATADMAIAAGYNPKVVKDGKWDAATVAQMVNGLAPGDPGYDEALAAVAKQPQAPSANPPLG
jgi:hypothetical protein